MLQFNFSEQTMLIASSVEIQYEREERRSLKREVAKVCQRGESKKKEKEKLKERRDKYYEL